MQVEGVPKRLFIDGQLVETERTFPPLNPATSEVLRLPLAVAG